MDRALVNEVVGQIERRDVRGLQQRLARRRLDPNLVLLGGNTPLMLAVCTEQPDLARWLLEAGADPTHPAAFDSYDQGLAPGDTPASVAASRARHYFTEMVKAVVPGAGGRCTGKHLMEAVADPSTGGMLLRTARAALALAGDDDGLEVLADEELAAEALAAVPDDLRLLHEPMAELARLLGGRTTGPVALDAERLVGRWTAAEGTVQPDADSEERPIAGDELRDGLAADLLFVDGGAVEGHIAGIDVTSSWEEEESILIRGAAVRWDPFREVLTLTWFDASDAAWEVSLVRVAPNGRAAQS